MSEAKPSPNRVSRIGPNWSAGTERIEPNRSLRLGLNLPLEPMASKPVNPAHLNQVLTQLG